MKADYFTHRVLLEPGQKFVRFGELAHRIAKALHPVQQSEQDFDFHYGSTRVNLDEELRAAVEAGSLTPLDPLTRGRHSMPVGPLLDDALVDVEELRQFLKPRRIALGGPIDTSSQEQGRGAHLPDWDLWLNLPEVEIWQAVALSLAIEPDSIQFSRDGWMAGPGDEGPFVEEDSFPLKGDAEMFEKRLRLLKACLHERRHFSAGSLNMRASYRNGVRLVEFVTWASRINLFAPIPRPLLGLIPLAAAENVRSSVYGRDVLLALLNHSGATLPAGYRDEENGLIAQSGEAKTSGFLRAGHKGDFSVPVLPYPFTAGEFVTFCRVEQVFADDLIDGRFLNDDGSYDEAALSLLSDISPAAADLVRSYLATLSQLSGPLPAGSTPQVLMRGARQSWRDVAWDYVVERLKSGQFDTATALNYSLHDAAGSEGSPFEKGVGRHRGNLWVREISRPLSLKTLQNAWRELQQAAKGA